MGSLLLARLWRKALNLKEVGQRGGSTLMEEKENGLLPLVNPERPRLPEFL